MRGRQTTGSSNKAFDGFGSCSTAMDRGARTSICMQRPHRTLCLQAICTSAVLAAKVARMALGPGTETTRCETHALAGRLAGWQVSRWPIPALSHPGLQVSRPPRGPGTGGAIRVRDRASPRDVGCRVNDASAAAGCKCRGASCLKHCSPRCPGRCLRIGRPAGGGLVALGQRSEAPGGILTGLGRVAYSSTDTPYYVA